jgi:hypothetical protein
LREALVKESDPETREEVRAALRGADRDAGH